MRTKLTFYYLPVSILWNLDEVFIIPPLLFTNSHHSLMGKNCLHSAALPQRPLLKKSVNISVRASLVSFGNFMFTLPHWGILASLSVCPVCSSNFRLVLIFLVSFIHIAYHPGCRLMSTVNMNMRYLFNYT